MLRNRSRRAVRSSTSTSKKQGIMADDQWLVSSPATKSPPPGFLTGFLPKNASDPDGAGAVAAVSSPTSILDAKNFVNLGNPFGYVPKSPSNNKHEPPPQQQQQAIGLAIIDSIIDDESPDGVRHNISKPVTRMVLFGSKLKLHIPEAAAAAAPADSPKSPAEFGTKTRSSSSSFHQSQFMSPLSNTRNLMRQLSLKEMELSEDYTCVITHGPNPKTTHIFDECIVESNAASSQQPSSEPTTKMESSSFLSFCHYCKDILRQDKDIYMYRGEKAFCSHECRSQEMMMFEGNQGTKK